MKYFIPLLCVFLVGCGADSLHIDTAPVKISIIQPTAPAPVSMLPVEFKVINKTNQNSQLPELLSNNSAFIAMTARDYENLSLNLADIVRYIKQQQGIIKYYEDMTKPSVDNAASKTKPQSK